MSRKWNLPLTYEPKIQPVIDGKCSQTIRVGKKFAVGDQVAFHGWQGKPRRSPWSFRTKYFVLRIVCDIAIKPWGIILPLPHYTAPSGEYSSECCLSWENLDWLAEKDGIIPPTGEALRDVLMSKNKIPDGGIEAQITRW